MAKPLTIAMPHGLDDLATQFTKVANDDKMPFLQKAGALFKIQGAVPSTLDQDKQDVYDNTLAAQPKSKTWLGKFWPALLGGAIMLAPIISPMIERWGEFNALGDILMLGCTSIMVGTSAFMGHSLASDNKTEKAETALEEAAPKLEKAGTKLDYNLSYEIDKMKMSLGAQDATTVTLFNQMAKGAENERQLNTTKKDLDEANDRANANTGSGFGVGVVAGILMS